MADKKLVVKEQVPGTQGRQLPWKWILGGLGVLGALIVAQRKNIAKIGSMAFDAAKKLAFEKILDAGARPFVDTILKVASEQQINPFLLAGFMWQESGYGLMLRPKGPGGYGDLTPRTWFPSGCPVEVVGKNADGKTLYMPKGHLGWGFGLMQVDWATQHEWLSKNNWADPYVNMTKGSLILKEKMAILKKKFPKLADEDLFKASVAAYNTGEGNVIKSLLAGKDVDTTTAHGNYSARVTEKGMTLQRLFESVAGRLA